MAKMTLRILTFVFCTGFVLVPQRGAAASLQVKSPDGDISISFDVKKLPQPYLPGERPYYTVSYKGVPILTDSPLGLDFEGAPPLDHDLQIVSSDQHLHDAYWTFDFGARRSIRDHYSELHVELRETQPPGRRLDLFFRAYNEGVAFRYSVPKQEHLEKFTLMAEGTGFYFARDASAYALNLGRFNTSNEGEYRRISLDEIKPASIVNLPLLVEIPNGPWVGLLEADLTNYAGMYLGGVPGFEHALVSRLSPGPGRMDEVVAGTAPLTSPWRLLLIGDRPGDLIQNDFLILNLNPPSVLTNTAWIEPGKSAWDWWSGSFARNVSFKPGMNTATMKHYIDFAATHKLQYMLIDAGWSKRDDILHWIPAVDLPEILAYAKSKDIKVLLWLHWTAVNKQMDQAFPLYQKWGVAGIKVDFMDRDDQEMVDFYHRVVREAAKYHLVVDLHGAYKPTGLRRTYPNLLTREGVMGMEYSKWSDRVTPEHDVTIPFTRMLAGPMDYTPGCFNNATREQFIPRGVEPMCQGTRAHQLAMYVVYLSPLVMLSDYPEDYDNKPGMEFLEKVPTVWDETRVVNGEPGKYITVARKHGSNWYLGAMTNWTDRDLEVPLDFLGSGPYLAQIFKDGSDADKVATSLTIDKKWVKAGDKLKVHLASGGGVAVILSPVG